MLLSLDTDIDVNKLAEIVLKQEKRILKKYPPNSSQGKLNDGNTGLGESSLTSRFNSFNVLRWKGTTELKESIIYGYKKCYPNFKGKLLVQCWANVMRMGEKITAHRHFPEPFDNTLCGHLNVRTIGTSTYYDGEEVKNKTGEMVMFSPEIVHWTDKCIDEPRITIAFDVMPQAKKNFVTLSI